MVFSFSLSKCIIYVIREKQGNYKDHDLWYGKLQIKNKS